jgi:hypothetical protein
MRLDSVRATTLGRSGLEVSRIAFGTWQLGRGWGQFDEDAVSRQFGAPAPPPGSRMTVAAS